MVAQEDKVEVSLAGSLLGRAGPFRSNGSQEPDAALDLSTPIGSSLSRQVCSFVIAGQVTYFAVFFSVPFEGIFWKGPANA